MQIQSTKFAKNDNAKHFGRSSITNKPTIKRTSGGMAQANMRSFPGG
jgi:hypothetical protein